MNITTWLTFVTVISDLIVIPGSSSLLITLHGGKMSILFSKPNFLSWFNRITGGMFVGFGVLLAGYNKN